MIIVTGIIFFLLGAVMGSFFNVIIYRLPKSISIVTPPSHCPGCGEKIQWKDNIPIISYIILNGKCRNCDFHIPIKYLVVETISAFLFLFSYLRFGISLELFTFLVFVSLLIPISFIDLHTTLIPDSISISGIVLGLALSVFRGLVLISLIGAIAGALLILIIIIAGRKVYKQEVMGYGDIKLAAMIGAFVGWAGVLLRKAHNEITSTIRTLSGNWRRHFVSIRKMDNTKPVPALTKIFFGLIYNNQQGLAYLLEKINQIAEIDVQSKEIPFDFTDYYKEEMGTSLKRKWVSIKKIIPENELVNLKHEAIKWEKELTFHDKRTVNCDPGGICDNRVVLVTTKNFSHRIYLGK
jgi:leader peptidase (prepilin peptidase)/N-methyltransferase